MRRRAAVTTIGTAIVSGCLRLQQEASDSDSAGNITLSETWTGVLLTQPFVKGNRLICNRSSSGGGYLRILNKAGDIQYESDELGGDHTLFLQNGDSVAIQDNAVFAVGTDMESSARLAAFHADSGDRIWAHDTDSDSPRDYMRHVVSDGERVYVAVRERWGQIEYPNTVIKALSVRNGDIEWEKEYPDNDLRGLAVFDSKLFAGFSDALEMFDATTGDTIAETVIDETRAADGFVSVDNQIYTIDSEIRAHSLDTGDEIWSIQRDRDPYTSTVSNNRLYCGADLSDDGGYLTAHNLDNKSKIWEVKLDHGIPTTPAATQSTVFVGSRSGNYSGVDIETGDIAYTDEIEGNPGIDVAALDESLFLGVVRRDGSYTQRLEVNNQ